MTVIAQDDHLTAGAWAACGVYASIRQNFRTIHATGYRPVQERA